MIVKFIKKVHPGVIECLCIKEIDFMPQIGMIMNFDNTSGEVIGVSSEIEYIVIDGMGLTICIIIATLK